MIFCVLFFSDNSCASETADSGCCCVWALGGLSQLSLDEAIGEVLVVNQTFHIKAKKPSNIALVFVYQIFEPK